MDQLVLFIYTRPLPGLILAVGVALCLWWCVRLPLWEKVGHPKGWRAGALVLLLLWMAAVLWITLLRRDETERQMVLQPFWSYWEVFVLHGNNELLRSNFMNALLFLPGGLLLGEMVPRTWRWRTVVLALVLFGVLSAAIESLQWVFALGMTETDDVIHNTLGGLLGSLPAAVRPLPWAKRRRK